MGRLKFCAGTQRLDAFAGAGHGVRERGAMGATGAKGVDGADGADGAGRGVGSRRTQPGGGRGRGGATGRLNKNDGRESKRIGAWVVRVYDGGRLGVLLRFSG